MLRHRAPDMPNCDAEMEVQDQVNSRSRGGGRVFWKPDFGDDEIRYNSLKE